MKEITAGVVWPILILGMWASLTQVWQLNHTGAGFGEIIRQAAGTENFKSNFADSVVVDTENNSYVASDGRKLGQVTIDKFDRNGMLLESWIAHSGSLGNVDEFKTGPDQRLYLSVDWGRSIYSFSRNGELLWSHETGESDLAYQKHLPGTFDFSEDGRVVHAASRVLTLISPEGALVAQRTARSAGVDGFSNAVIMGDSVVVVGLAGFGTTQMLEFDTRLALIKSTQLGIAADYARISNIGRDQACAVLTELRHDSLSWFPSTTEHTSVYYAPKAQKVTVSPATKCTHSPETTATNP